MGEEKGENENIYITIKDQSMHVMYYLDKMINKHSAEVCICLLITVMYKEKALFLRQLNQICAYFST